MGISWFAAALSNCVVQRDVRRKLGHMRLPASGECLRFAFGRQTPIWGEAVHHIRQGDIQAQKNLGLGQTGFLCKFSKGFLAKCGFKRVNAKGHVRLVRYPTVGRVALTSRLEAVNQIAQSGRNRTALKELTNLGDEAVVSRSWWKFEGGVISG